MGKALNLDKLLEGTKIRFWQDREDRENLMERKFIKLFKKYNHFYGCFSIPREKIKNIIIKNQLVHPGADPEQAVDEALKRRYNVPAYSLAAYAYFEEVYNSQGNISYKICYMSVGD